MAVPGATAPGRYSGGIFFDGEAMTLAEIAKAQGKGKVAVAAVAAGRVLDLSATAEEGAEVRILTAADPEGIEVVRHSTAHVMAAAVKELFPEARITIGPAIENGFYYDFDVAVPFTPEDLDRIEKRMAEIAKADLPFERIEASREEARALFPGEPYKAELLDAIPEGETVSLYRVGPFLDLCRGPHVPSSGRVGAFKLTGTSGAYWRGDAKNAMLARIYGVCFATRKELDAHLAFLEEVKKRDHRRIGKALDLFSVSDDVGPGLILWHPKGARVRRVMEDFWRSEHEKGGYEIVFSPHVARLDLWHTSGHTDFYRANMFSPIEVEGQDYQLKPMNCPFHIHVYKSRLRSYRELPIRYAELGTVYRYEPSGTLHGLLRVRGFTQDDAHLFLRPDQLDEEIYRVLDFTFFILKSFGFEKFDVYLSTRPEKFTGTLDSWEKAEAALSGALTRHGVDFTVDPGEGVFYGPKIDIKIKDTLGRAWQCSTIQVDFNLPERFDATFVGEDGAHHRAIMVHRALMGSLERFFGVLVEHHAGAFPAWLAPVQVDVLPLTEHQHDYAREVVERLRSEGFRVEGDFRNEKLGYKIRESQLSKVPYALVLGERETEQRQVAPRKRGGEQLEPMGLDAFASMLRDEVSSRQ
jgi:threonyl-tRNA synthetase